MITTHRQVSYITRRTFVRQVASATSLLALGSTAATSSRVPRIGYISGDLPPLTNAFLDELRAQGFVDGQSIMVEQRLVNENSDVPGMATELAGMNLDMIVAGPLPFAILVRKANQHMPVVIVTGPGLVSNGFAQSLARPGGIYTGMDELPPGLTAKRLTLLKAAVPAAKRIALLSTTPGVGGHEAQLEDAERAARHLDVTVKPYRAGSPLELERALAAIATDKPDGLLNFQGGLSVMKRQMIVDFAAEHRLPAVYQATMFAEAGGLMAWAPDLPEQFREAARMTVQILRGAKPGDLPIKHPREYFLTINASTAKKLGLPLPATLLAQAHRVIS